jgi:hypothetical protein
MTLAEAPLTTTDGRRMTFGAWASDRLAAAA